MRWRVNEKDSSVSTALSNLEVRVKRSPVREEVQKERKGRSKRSDREKRRMYESVRVCVCVCASKRGRERACVFVCMSR